ncbi:MAG: MotA/TolQ/ExbB proton channel family protein [Synechococcaceae cyanobacterium]|nr:MotA/TolQ/ExbB proton channel family protein [Synechococcaceae cyanobacterium]
MNASFVAMPLATGVPLLVLSIAVLTVSFERARWWFSWWRARLPRRRRLARQRRQPGALAQQLESWAWEMRFGEPLLQAATVLAPLLGLSGTVLALMQVLAALGPDLTLPPGASVQGYGQVLMSTLVGLVVSLMASTSLFANQGLRRWQLGRLRRLARRAIATGGGSSAGPGGAR